ncbi:SPOR domain-containing protein [Pseudidiomarina halophila]|uniref:SPOR domain-containing protein n=1 Tax=Pseudidiomarina halophila TaxID=1449799 RepID=A0A432XZL9_9GAMM|nr:SPOR domain-containing protein [Pseudidiomarina halophila]RUO54064.1 SPOR domain-containing protein [Pseudidiomarina halophila]
MASQLQNRIVGSIILIALAVIILPELLDGKQMRQEQDFEAMPLQPEADVVEQQVTLPANELEGTAINVEQASDDEITLTAEAAPDLDETAAAAGNESQSEPAPTVPDPAPATLQEPGWVIQLGAFSNADSVDKLMQQLQQQGFAAYREATQVNGKTLIRLFVGPALTQAELEQQLPELKELTGLNGRVVRFEP